MAITSEEKRVAKQFFDKKYLDSSKTGDWLPYCNSLGWILYNAINLRRESVLKHIFDGLDVIKQGHPKAFKSFIDTCKKNEDCQSEIYTDNVIDFPSKWRKKNQKG